MTFMGCIDLLMHCSLLAESVKRVSVSECGSRGSAVSAPRSHQHSTHWQDILDARRSSHSFTASPYVIVCSASDT